MEKRLLGAMASLAVAVISLTGCAENIESATPTPVNFKACLISDGHRFTDGGLNQDAYYGLLQSEAQYGVGTSVVELTDGASARAIARAGRKLVSRGCNLVIGLGDAAAGALVPLANGNPQVRFAAVGYHTPVSTTNFKGKNLDITSFDSKVAYLQAGYLAAAKSVTGKVGVVATAGDASVITDLWYFRQGVYQWEAAKAKHVEILAALQAEPASWNLVPVGATNDKTRAFANRLLQSGADVLMPIGVNGLVVAQQALAYKSLVIGSDTDWAAQPRYAAVAAAVLASVEKPVSQTVAAEVGAAVAGQAATFPVATVVPATLTPESKVVWGDGMADALAKLATDYAAGKLTVVEETN